MMQYLVLTVLSFALFIFKINCDEYFSTHGHWRSANKFSPMPGDCYEIYDQDEKVTAWTCQKQADLEKQSCVDLLPGDDNCLGFKTPTNETVKFLCVDTPEELLSYHSYTGRNECFKVYNVDNTFKTVCLQNFDRYSQGITTPDNFTIMLNSHYCNTSMSIVERKMFNNFIDSYSFDPGLKSCYKVYNPNQIVSPYTCLNKDVHESCIQELPKNKNCMGIITQNNETVTLDCAESGEKSLSTHNCFKIYTSDDKVHVACQEKLEERCVGITTPSNLTVLFDCYYCSKPHVKYIKYDDHEEQKKNRDFVKSYINKEYGGEHSYLETITFTVFGPYDFVEPCSYSRRSKYYAYWLPNTNCYGITLENNETVVLECIPKERKVNSGCFQVINSEKKETEACIRVLDESCVGVTTPKNFSVVLACSSPCYRGNYLPRYKDPHREKLRMSAENALYNYAQGHYVIKNSYEVSTEKDDDYWTEVQTVHLLRGHNNCWGLTLKSFETIVLECPDKMPEKHGCFDVYSSIDDKIRNSPEQKVQSVCVQVLDENHVGIITPNNWTLILDWISEKQSDDRYNLNIQDNTPSRHNIDDTEDDPIWGVS